MWSGTSIYNEGPRVWKNLFALTRFRFMEVLFHIFCHYWGKKYRSLYRGLRLYRGLLYRGSTVKSLHSISTHHQPVVVKLSSIYKSWQKGQLSSFLDFFSSEDSHKYTPCMSTVGNAKNNRGGLSENKMPTSYTIRTHALKKRLV